MILVQFIFDFNLRLFAGLFHLLIRISATTSRLLSRFTTCAISTFGLLLLIALVCHFWRTFAILLFLLLQLLRLRLLLRFGFGFWFRLSRLGLLLVLLRNLLGPPTHPICSGYIYLEENALAVCFELNGSLLLSEILRPCIRALLLFIFIRLNPINVHNCFMCFQNCLLRNIEANFLLFIGLEDYNCILWLN